MLLNLTGHCAQADTQLYIYKVADVSIQPELAIRSRCVNILLQQEQFCFFAFIPLEDQRL